MRDRNVALLVAAGQGSRAGGDIPKQYRPIGGKPVLAHAVDALAKHPAVDSITLVVAAGQEAHARAMLGDRPIDAIIPGPTAGAGPSGLGLSISHPVAAQPACLYMTQPVHFSLAR